jgi:alkaline phosphatase D
MFAPLLMPPLPHELGAALAELTGTFPADGVAFNGDQWDGYQAERREVIEHLADHGVTAALFLTGDIHT